MEQTQILCFQPGVTVKTIKERQKLDDNKITELNQKLNFFSNSRIFNYEDILKFNKISGLYVNFKCGEYFYAINFDFDGKDVFFQASLRVFNNKEYDSEDEEDNKMTSYHFVPFDRLKPEKLTDGKYELTLDMYFDFVQKCLTSKEPVYVKKKCVTSKEPVYVKK